MRRTLALIVLGVLALAGAAGHWKERYLNADSLYLPALYQDLFIDPVDVSRWNLTPAPSFFPDAALLFPLLAATSGPGHAQAIYLLVWWALVLGAFGWLAREAGYRAGLFGVLTAGALLSARFLDQPWNLIGGTIFVPNHHGGAFLIGVVLLALFLRNADRGFSRGSAAAYLVLAAATVFSDLILVPWFLVPIAAAAALGAALGRVPARLAWQTILLGGGAWGIGRAIEGVLAGLGLFEWHSAFTPNDGSWRTALKVLGIQASLFPPVAVGVALGMLVALGVVVRAVRERTNENLTAPLLITTAAAVSMVGAVAGAAATGNLDHFAIRYLHPLILLPAFVLAILATSWDRRRNPALAFLVGAVFTAAALWSGAQIVPALGRVDWDELRRPYPAAVECLDHVAGEFGVSWGYTDYWGNKYVTMLSRTGLRANLISNRAMLWHFSNNPAWYRQRVPGGPFPPYAFLVAYPDAASSLRERFGEPFRERPCKQLKVLIYNRPEDVAFRNRLRIPALFDRGPEMAASGRPILGRSVVAPLPERAPESGVLCAAGHGDYTPDGSAVTPAKEVGGMLLFVDAGPSDVLEIALRGESAHQLTLWSDEEPVAVLEAPAMGSADLWIHYLRLPAPAAAISLRRIDVRADAAAGPAIGHACLYADSLPHRDASSL